MSKKRKLILAAAVFSAALFAASCGGGGGSTAGTGGGSGGNGSSGGSGGGGGGGGETPPASVEAKVLAQLTTGVATAGPVNPVAVCELKSDNKAYCGNDLNPSENAVLTYIHEFDNGNVVLRNTGDILYFFDASSNTLTKLTSFRAVGSSSESTASTGITIPAGATIQTTPNLVMMYNNAGDLVVVTKSGKVIRDSNINVPNNNASCEKVEKSGFTYSLSVDGTSSFTSGVPTDLNVSAGGMHLVRRGNSIYLTSDKCSVDLLVDNIAAGVQDAKMVKVGNDFFIAVRDNTANIHYYRVSGSTVTRILSNAPGAIAAPIATPGNGIYDYALAGNGYLFAIDQGNPGDVNIYDTTGVQVTGGAVNVTPAANNVTGLLAFGNRVLAVTNVPDVREVDSAGNVNNTPAGADTTALQRCTTPLPAAAPFVGTQANDGMGTNFNRCVFDDGGGGGNVGLILYSLVYDTVNARYRITSANLNADAHTIVNRNQILFGADKVLIPTNGNILLGTVNLCSTTLTPSISCSDTGLSGIDDLTLSDLTRVYLGSAIKFSGNNVFYVGGGIPRVGNIFDPKPMPITVIGASGGNASFDLTKFAFSFRPAGATCNTQIAYLSSPTAAPKFYTIAQPSNTCVNNILKVFP
jgi:hypothetical protein